MSFDPSTASREELLSAYTASLSINQFLKKDNQTLQNNLNQQVQDIQKYQQTIKEQAERIKWFERQVFGVRSERLLSGESRQIPLFEVPETPPAETVTVKSFERTARTAPTVVDESEKARFSDSVPVDEVVILPEEVQGLSEEQYEVIGEKVTERLAYIPIQYRVKRTIRKTVKLKEQILTAPAPEAVIDKSFADVSFIAGLITDKFQYHLPLYRQHQRMQRAGVNVSREYLSKLTLRSLELLEPIYNAILSAIVSSETVSMDETPVRAGHARNKMKIGWFWAVANKEQVAFVFSEDRKKENVQKILGALCKKMMADGYGAYDSYAESRKDLIRAQCWAHVRRYFFEAKEHSPPEAQKVLLLIAKLFAIEQKTRDLEELAQLRRTESTPIIEQIFLYLNELWYQKIIDPSSLLGKAVQYAMNAEKELRVFLSHPDIPLSNNQVERAIRPVALGRKNWLFCWSELGAKYAAMAFTIVESCKMANVDPFQYLSDILVRISEHPVRDVHLLTPVNWKIHFLK